MRPLALLAVGLLSCLVRAQEPRRDFSIPQVDLMKEDKLFTTVERRKTYLGHPSTVLFHDGKTLLVAYPDGHGRGNLIFRRSADAGQTWVALPPSGQRVMETPVLYRLDLPAGRERVLMVPCQPRANVLEWMWSDDRGDTWSGRQQWKLEGPKGIIVALASLWPLPGKQPAWRGVFHDFAFDNWTVDLKVESALTGPPPTAPDFARRGS